MPEPSTDTNRCRALGYVTSPRYPIPSDRSAFSGPGSSETTPCSNIQCSGCGATVRSLDGYMFDGRKSDLRKAWEAEDLTTAPGVDTGPQTLPTRMYLCRCSALNSPAAKPLSLRHTELFHDELPATWACGGHPLLTLPASFDGAELPAAPDWPTLVEQNFRAPQPEGDPYRWGRWIAELFVRLQGTPHQAALDKAAAACLVSDDALLVREAIAFFWHPVRPPSAVLLRALALDHADRLQGMADPRGTTDLYSLSLQAVGYHLGESEWAYDDPMKAVFRAQAERPGALGTVGLALAKRDKDWLRENRDRLVEQSPEARKKVDRWLR